MAIYLDMLILENFIVNYFLVTLSCKTINIKYSILRNIIAALIGSLSCAFFIFFYMPVIVQGILKFLIAFLMIFIAMKNKISNMIKGFFTLLVYSMVLAGICIFFIYTEKGVLPQNTYIINFPYKKLLIVMMIAYLLVNRVVIYIKDRITFNSLIYDIEINLKGNKKTVTAFLDTGNELREPVTNLPVIIVEDNVFNKIDLKKEDEFLIPYKVVNGKNDTLKGVKATSIKLFSKSKSFEIKEGIIAFCNTNLSKSGEYKALLSRGIL
ncbi:sigma-E processing peptidase SpoIIGA [Hathewaya limosa]|uniref:Sporulation sigma-E factor-processing peptidase n=1 Tax=Hathewaya limosa TaxID=1536 RepID=A0ABU0JPH1_HATLI|nr:sigma-E processing peptidase SpoIIGA [Hathewaya limosa]MDQ0478965.1 stage II sporulation protein GA (sporulation sigma-E factor processing peptidase) [Hathewaya limosa]